LTSDPPRCTLLTKALDKLPEPAAPPLPQTLHEFFMSSPLRGANLNLERQDDYPRTPEIE
jgi:hypothetical protein